jgi:signal transduction histidine kinase
MMPSPRADLDATVMGLSTRLLGVGIDELGSTVREALADLCRVFQLDRTYVLKMVPGTPTAELFEEWWADDVPGASTAIPELPREAQRFWRDSLLAGAVVHLPDVEAAPPESDDGAAAAAALSRDGVRSILFVPLVAKEATVGFIGFEARRELFEWSPQEVDLVRTVGEMLVSAVDRCSAEAALKQTASDLAVRNADLERSNHDLEQFASVVSHDLKTPLVVVRGYLDLLLPIAKAHPTRGEEAVGFGSAAQRGVERMARLIDDLLEYALAGRPLSTSVPVALDHVAADVVTDLGADLTAAGVRCTVGPLPELHGEPTQLRQLIQNLVSNAIRFRGESDPTVEVTATRSGNGWLIVVADNGVGIEPELRSDVFAMFSRGAASSHSPGTGIGLAICARVAANHGGRIWVEANPGGGTRICVWLPE